jgi:hypothetical protein
MGMICHNRSLAQPEAPMLRSFRALLLTIASLALPAILVMTPGEGRSRGFRGGGFHGGGFHGGHAPIYHAPVYHHPPPAYYYRRPTPRMPPAAHARHVAGVNPAPFRLHPTTPHMPALGSTVMSPGAHPFKHLGGTNPLAGLVGKAGAGKRHAGQLPSLPHLAKLVGKPAKDKTHEPGKADAARALRNLRKALAELDPDKRRDRTKRPDKREDRREPKKHRPRERGPFANLHREFAGLLPNAVKQMPLAKAASDAANDLLDADDEGGPDGAGLGKVAAALAEMLDPEALLGEEILEEEVGEVAP